MAGWWRDRFFPAIAEKAARYLDLEPHEEIRKALPVERVALTNASHP